MLIDLKAQGKTNHQVAQHFGVSVPSVNGQVFKHSDKISARALQLEYERETFKLSATEVSECTEEVERSKDVLPDVIELLREFQNTFLLGANLDRPTGIYKLGIAIGQYSTKVDAMLERLSNIAE